MNDCPKKMTREKFQRKRYFFTEKDSRFNPRLVHKSSFLIAQVPIEKYGLKTLFSLFNIYRRLRAKFWPDCAIPDTSMEFGTVVDHD